MRMGIGVLEYLASAVGQTIPPMVLELVLTSGQTYYVKQIFSSGYNPDAELIPILVWDLRALSAADRGELLHRISQLQTADGLDIESLHRKLDQGNLWVRAADIEAVVEWHDRFWPDADERERRAKIGGPA